jgi:hypothetical protein
MINLTVFANFFIDTEERFLRMQDSFHSFSSISANRWVINVRGRYSTKTQDFLRLHLGDKLTSYELNSEEGWFHDVRIMLPNINGEYVFFWLEDHINLAKIDLLENIVKEMQEKDLEYMLYSFWQNGRLRQRYNGISLTRGTYLDFFQYNISNHSIIQSNVGGSYIISVAAIFKFSLFKSIVMADDPIPRRWPKETPFDFEKSPQDTHWLPIKMAISKQELFASIDDDHECEGYCLQSRGLYPIRENRKSYAVIENVPDKSLISHIKIKLSPLKSEIKSLFKGIYK